MIDESVVVAALARDCDDNLRRNIPRIEELRSHFRQSRVVVVENDSKDGTKQTLKNWQKQSQGVDLIMNDFGTQTIPTGVGGSTSLHRIEKMARYRNMYMDFVRGLDEQPDYLIVIDVDVEDFSVAGLIKAIENAPQDWSALFALGVERFYNLTYFMYDMFAYVHKEMPVPHTEKYMFSQKRKVVPRVKKEVYSPCSSAFGGIGVYKWKFIKELSYRTQVNNDELISTLCEHIPFNLTIDKKYICRDIFVDYGRCPKKIAARMMMPECLFQILRRLR